MSDVQAPRGKASTTEVGNAFRDLVCDLLRTKYPDLRVERRIAGTKVDIRFTKEDLGRTDVCAVECKDYAKPLDKGYVSKEIYPLYEPMLRNGEISRVLIVSRAGVTTDADEYIRAWTGASHLTYEQLAESLVGLRRYIQYLAGLQPTDGTDYVEARLEGVAGSALEAVEQWVDEADGAGRAVLGSYGQGKTSFARRLASHFAAKHLADPVARMPLLLRLGDVVHETQLEGLFGKEFTARHPCPGYQFRTLEHLNKSGRLLIILDGFDEMKHAMTAADFQANFREFSRLLTGRAKVLLLGRPNALPSDEREFVFRGRSQIGDQTISMASQPTWPEWKVAYFEEHETRRLLTSLLTLYQQTHERDGRFTYPTNFVARRVAEVFKLVTAELLRRPVHVQLIADLAADPSFDLRGFNEHRLYDHFIRKMVERDTVEKQARRPIPLEARLGFQRELAWWAWRRPDGTQGCFFRHEVPATILKDLPNGNAVDEEGKRNEYIVSTLTEEKESGVLFFAHRSFQEFLVAERMRLVKPTPAAHTDYSRFLTEDVSNFIRQAPDQAFILDWYQTLQASSGPIEVPYLQFFASYPQVLKRIDEDLGSREVREVDVWTALIIHHASVQKTKGALSEAGCKQFMRELVVRGDTNAAAVGSLSLLSHLQLPKALDYAGLNALVAAVMERCLRASRGENASGSFTIAKEDVDFASSWVQAISKLHQQEMRGHSVELELAVDLAGLERLCCMQMQSRGPSPATLLNPITFADVQSTTGVKHQVPSAQVYRHIDPELVKKYSRFLRSRGSSFPLVVVDTKSRAQPKRHATILR